MERYIVSYIPNIKNNRRVKWYIHSQWDDRRDAERTAAFLRRRWYWNVKITAKPIGAWSIIRNAARRVWKWFVAEGAHALGEVLAGMSLLAFLLLLPILMG